MMTHDRVGDPGDGTVPTAIPGESRYVETNGVTLHTIDAGPTTGRLVVLLHGFPEFWYGWAEAIRPLVEAGYRVLVPDQRGYNRSKKPDTVSAYSVDALAADIVGLIDACDRETAAIVGHDWGAAVGWWTALHHPGRLSGLVAANVPHPTVFTETLRTSWRQRFSSWYFLAFQVPALPERAVRLGNWRPVTRVMRRTSRSNTFSEADFDHYRRAWDQPGAFTGMVNWYRAVVRDRPSLTTDRVTVPTKLLWGDEDRFLESEMARASVDKCETGTLRVFPEATHWIHHEQPTAVSDAITSHLQATDRA